VAGSGTDEGPRASVGTEVVRASPGPLGQSRSLTLAGATQFGASPGERPPAGVAAPLLRGDVVGRYVIITLLGQGGMGVVYAAYDPELDRRVALKLLLAGGSGSSSGARTRLLREAQALAQLSHPNVVAVHDVGTLGEQVWLAMEYVEGQTLTAWLGERRRGWQEVVAAFYSAGEGLRAAHAAGLVHRDFKPDNVMIGADGRVRVMDFGLARAGKPGEDAPMTAPARPQGVALNTAVTQAGTIIGTPIFVAPELWHGAPADARADQFAFCVALWQGLYGERPFGGESIAEIVLEVTKGLRREPPAGAGVPTWLRRVLERGLATEPEARWPTMAALLQALGQGAGRRRRRLLLLALLAALAAFGAAAGLVALERGRRARACEAEGQRIRGVWHEEARAALRRALGVEATAARVERSIDEFATAWTGARTQACRLRLVDRAWDQATSEQAQACLQAARWSLEGLLAVLAEADERAGRRAAQAAAGLPALAPCLDPRALALRPAPPQDPAAQVELAQVGRLLERAASLEAAGRYADGASLARALLGRADALTWAPLAARVRLVAGALAGRAGQAARSEALLEEARVLATRAGEELLAADVEVALTRQVGGAQARPVEGLRLGRLAQARLEHLGQAQGLRGATLQAVMSDLHRRVGAQAEARSEAAAALEIRERLLGPAHPDVATDLIALGGVVASQGEVDAARRLYERALAIRVRALGPEHPEVADVLTALATSYHGQGDMAEAQRLFERVLVLRERALGPAHPDVARALNNVAVVLQARGDLVAAQRLYERSVVIWSAVSGDHPLVGRTMINLARMYSQRHAHAAAQRLYERALALLELRFGSEDADEDIATALNGLAVVHYERKEYAEAQRLYERALRIREKLHGPDHADVADVLNNLAELFEARGELAAAEALQRRVLAIYGRTLAPDDREFAFPLHGLAVLAQRQGRLAEAVPLFERALRASQQEGTPVVFAATLRRSLAQALWDGGGDRPRAHALMREAIELLGRGEGVHAAEQADALAWLAAHPLDGRPARPGRGR